MCTFLGFAEIINGSSGDDIDLKIKIVLQDLLQRKNFWHTVDDCQHNNAVGDLHLGILIQVIEHNVGRCFFFKHDLNVHTISVGMVFYI